MKLTAAVYLGQLEEVELWIQQEKETLKEIEHNIAGVKGMDYSTERVQTSPSGGGLEESVIKMIEKKAEINREINRLSELKNKIKNQIRGIRNAKYEKVLHMRYVQHKPMKQIAFELDITSSYASTLCKNALEDFENTYKLEWFDVC